ncbi:MAG: DNA polymerase-3 subunit delta' [Paracoccaceae bacterium]
MNESVLPWHIAQWQQIDGLRENDRMPHALLLSGPEGIGKRRFARVLMQALVCEAPTAQGACGQCRECHFGMDHPDLHTITTLEGKKQIGVDQVRELVEVCNKTAHSSGGRKVIQIFPADAMNNNTANALLKTLEEPSGDTVLILVSDTPARLLATIRSRCRKMAFPVPERELALDWLRVMIPDEAQCLACLGEMSGRPLAAKALFEADGLARRSQCDASLSAWAAGHKTLFEAVDALLENEVEFLLDWLSQRFHVLFRSHMVAQAEHLQEPWSGWVARPAKAISQQLDLALELRAQLQRGVALNKRLTLESFLIAWA